MADKIAKIGGKNMYWPYILWLSVSGILGHYYFHIAGLLRGENQLVHQVTAAALLKYGKKCTLPMCDFEKSSVLHIFAH